MTAPARQALDPQRADRAFASLLARTRPRIEAALERTFDALLAARASTSREVATTYGVARELTMRGGKRFRAALAAAAYEGLAPKPIRGVAVAAGTSLELLQSYLLIQDDWMDGDVERRGGPSAHVALADRLGRSTRTRAHDGAIGAILAGDVVFGLAIGALRGAKVEPAIALRALAQLERIHEDVVTGQILDTLATKPDVERLHELKTGSYTVRGPLELGAILAGAGAPVVRALGRFARPLGVAFQLRDDLLGVFGTEVESGRPPGSDLRAGKDTSVIRIARAELRSEELRAFEAVWGDRGAKPRDVARVVRTIEATTARSQVERRLATLCDEAELFAMRLPLTERARHELAGASRAFRIGPGGRVAQ